jgi:xylitol oxidase
VTSTLRWNWARSHVIAGRRLRQPRSVDELQELVAQRPAVRAIGTGHTFNELPDSPGDLVSLAALPRRYEPGRDGTVTVDAGVRYADIADRLDRDGVALEAMASLAHLSVAGACATGTHGSGDRTGSLATAVAGLELVTASGSVVRIRRSAAASDLPGVVVSLGAFGIVTAMTLDVVPRYEVHQVVYQDVPLDRVLARFDEVTSAGTSVSLFTRWQASGFHQVWCKQRAGGGSGAGALTELLGRRPADGPRHPIPGHDPSACTAQGGIPGPWHERLPHFRADRTPSSGHELQSEYLLDRRHGPAALAALSALGRALAPALLVSEVRTVAADDLWLSPAYGRPSVAVHFTWRPDREAVTHAVSVVERALAPFDPRPHWGKVWSLPIAAVRASFPRYGEVVALRDRWDPGRKFTNRYVDTLLGD